MQNENDRSGTTTKTKNPRKTNAHTDSAHVVGNGTSVRRVDEPRGRPT